MKNKLLVLTLAFAMMLSFMPMASFAACDHENTYEDYVWGAGVRCIPVNNRVHSVTGTGAKEIWCADCDTMIKSVPYEFDGDKFSHDYDEDGYCETCGHQNTCPHENTYDEYYWEEGEATCTPAGNKYHKVTGTGEKETWCEDCEMMTDSDPSYVFNGEEEIRHDYDEDGYCELCGHQNTCPHDSDNKEEMLIWDDDTEWTPVDDEYHSVTGTAERQIWCEDCGKMIKKERCPFNGEQEPHDYDEDGYCETCDYQRALPDESDERICGSSRYDTALAVADKMMEETGEKFDTIIVAYGENYPDALSGGYLAWITDAPILLVRPSMESKIANYIRENLEDGGTVYLLGGTGAVSASFESNLEQSGIYPDRLGGKNRYETNLKILDAAGVTDEDILVCTGTGYADSLSASAAKWPILLVGGTLTDDQKNYIRGLDTEQFYLIGGTGAVAPKIESDLIDLGYSEDSIDRIAGATRHETSTAVAEEFFDEPDTVVLAYAKNFPDGLSGGPLAMLYDAPIILTESNKTKPAQMYVEEVDARRSITLGGTSLISDAAVKTIMGR